METSKVTLNEIEADDLKKLLAALKKREAEEAPEKQKYDFLGDTKLERDNIFNMPEVKPLLAAEISLPSEKQAGFIYLVPCAEKMAEMRFFICRPCRNKGYMTDAIAQIIEKAFGKLDLTGLFAHPTSYNLAALKALYKNGFTVGNGDKRYDYHYAGQAYGMGCELFRH